MSIRAQYGRIADAVNKGLNRLSEFKLLPYLPYPRSIICELTTYCPLRCLICPLHYSYGRAMDKGHMDLEKLKRLIDESHPYLDNVGLTGLGETVLYPHLREAVEYIRDKKPSVSIYLSTNASLPSSAEIIGSVMDKINSIQISIDGIGEVFEKLRKGATYDLFLSNVRRIARTAHEGGTDILFNMVILKENHHQMAEVIRLAKKIGIARVTFTPVNLASVDWDIEYYRFFHTPEFNRMLAEAKSAAAAEGVGLSLVPPTERREFRNCPYVWKFMYVTWDGYLAPCCAKPFRKELHFGNVFEKGLLRCLNSREAVKFRILSLRNRIPVFCRRCHWVVD